LGKDDHQNVWALAKKADALWSLHDMKTSFSALWPPWWMWRSLHRLQLCPSAVQAVAGKAVVEVLLVADLLALPELAASRLVASKQLGRQQADGQQAAGQPGAVPSLISKELTRIQRGLCLAHFDYGTRHVPALPHATGETGFPLASQCSIPWSTGPHHRPALQ
jgi:hypothetical protein